MKFDPDNTLYLDANFLIAYFVDKHPDYVASRLKMAEFREKKNILCISCLAIDETLFNIRKFLGQMFPEEKKKNWRDYYSQFKRAYDSIQETPQCSLVQFESDLPQGILNAIENIKDHNMEPRDAFHLAIMNDLKLVSIVTKDGDFENINGINRVPY